MYRIAPMNLAQQTIKLVQLVLFGIAGLVAWVSRLGSDRPPAANGKGPRPKLLGIIALLVIIGSIASILLRQCGSTQRVDRDRLRVIAEVAAQETIRLVGHSGRVVVLVWGAEGHRPPAVDEQVKTFRQTLNRESRVVLDAVEGITSADPYAEVVLQLDPLLKVMQKHPGVDAIVSFIDLQKWNPGDYQKFPTPRPKIVALTYGQLDIESLMRNNIVQVFIQPRTEPPPASAPPEKSAREWFDRHYQVITPTTGSIPR